VSDWLSGACRERTLREVFAAPASVYPHAGVCARCLRDRDDLFWHAEDAVFYCADVFRCEMRFAVLAQRGAGRPLRHNATRERLDVSLERKVWALVETAPEPFLVPDVTPRAARPSEVFHIVRDLVDAGALTRGDDGYRKVDALDGAGRLHSHNAGSGTNGGERP
jgi:hypothetical protein